MKTVAGFTLSSIKSATADRAIREGLLPDTVDRWVTWFCEQGCDHAGGAARDKCKGCQDEGGSGCWRSN